MSASRQNSTQQPIIDNCQFQQRTSVCFSLFFFSFPLSPSPKSNRICSESAVCHALLIIVIRLESLQCTPVVEENKNKSGNVTQGNPMSLSSHPVADWESAWVQNNRSSKQICILSDHRCQARSVKDHILETYIANCIQITLKYSKIEQS